MFESIELDHPDIGYPTLRLIIKKEYREKIKHFRWQKWEYNNEIEIGFNGIYFQIRNNYKICLSAGSFYLSYLDENLRKEYKDDRFIDVNIHCDGWSSIGLFQSKTIDQIIKEHNFPLKTEHYSVSWDGEIYPFSRTIVEPVYSSSSKEYIVHGYYKKSKNSNCSLVEIGHKYPDLETAIYSGNEWVKTGIVKKYNDPTKYISIKGIE